VGSHVCVCVQEGGLRDVGSPSFLSFVFFFRGGREGDREGGRVVRSAELGTPFSHPSHTPLPRHP
jgi:hypothetical protein